MTLQVDHLYKSYATPQGPLPILRDISLNLNRGEAIAIMGPSGSGKSTLLHILGTLDQPTAGTIRIDGEDPFILSPSSLANFRNRHIGFVFQDHHLLPQCSVLENVLLPTLVGPTDPGDSREWGINLLSHVGLGHRLHHRPAELSGGERQRVALARALIHRPLLLLADEPTGNLDRTMAMEIGQILMSLHKQRQTILVVVTHSQELADLFPQTLIMDQGQLHPPGKPAVLKK